MIDQTNNLERWKRAQKAEKNYWLSTNKSSSTEDFGRYWQEKLAHGFDLNYDFFKDKSVLEIGCGPHGIFYQLDNVKSRVGLEPMDLDDLVQEDWKKSLVKNGVAEKIPFENNSFDVVISFNNLDHCDNPGIVIEEIHRVLRYEGDFLLWVYFLRNQYYFLRNFLNKLDGPHPHHFNRNDIFRLLEDRLFSVKRSRYDKGTGLPNNTIKKIMGNFMMDTLWLWLVNKK